MNEAEERSHPGAAPGATLAYGRVSGMYRVSRLLVVGGTLPFSKWCLTRWVWRRMVLAGARRQDSWDGRAAGRGLAGQWDAFY